MINGNDTIGYTMICDHCEEELFDGENYDTFSDVNEARKSSGWLTGKGKKSKEWFNLCDVCKDDPEIRMKFFEDDE